MTGKPVKFIGMGEKMDALEPFYPDRMASRILGMGDVLSLIDMAEQEFDEEKAKKLEKKIKKNEFTLEDFWSRWVKSRRWAALQRYWKCSRDRIQKP